MNISRFSDTTVLSISVLQWELLQNQDGCNYIRLPFSCKMRAQLLLQDV